MWCVFAFVEIYQRIDWMFNVKFTKIKLIGNKYTLLCIKKIKNKLLSDIDGNFNQFCLFLHTLWVTKEKSIGISWKEKFTQKRIADLLLNQTNANQGADHRVFEAF